MIIVRLKGGLGNQMFQYAFGRNLSILHNTSLKLDSSYLRSTNQSARSYLLDNFQIINIEASANEINSYISTFQKIMDFMRPDSKKKLRVEHSTSFDSNVLSYSDGYFDGHWNNERYFKAHDATIRSEFKLRKPLGETARSVSDKITSLPNATSIHIRRGDYVSIKKIQAKHGVLPISYYSTSMDMIMERFPDAHFFIFSDDIGWVKENFPKKYSVTFVSSPEISDFEELVLMGMCKNNIIANSTFSWWGAWLNNNPNKTVIAPKRWFTNESEYPTDLIPQTWIKL